MLIAITSCNLRGGGIQRLMNDFIEVIQSSNQYDTFILNLNDERPDQSRVNSKYFNKKKIGFIISFLLSLIKFSPDIIVLGHLNFISLGVFAGLVFKKKIWCWLFGIEAWNLSLFTKLLGNKINGFISISEYTKYKFLASQPYSHIEVCYLSTAIPEVKETGIAAHLPNTPFILTVGRMLKSEPGKGHIQLITAMQIIKDKHPNVKLYIVGEGDLKEDLVKLSIEKNVNDKVQFLGFLPDDLLRQYYKTCIVFAMPSRQEGFGIVYLEAMANKKPCIASNIDAGKEVVLNNITGYTVNPDNNQEIVDAVSKIINNQDEYKSFGEEGYKRVCNFFSYDAFSKRILEIFSKIHV